MKVLTDPVMPGAGYNLEGAEAPECPGAPRCIIYLCRSSMVLREPLLQERQHDIVPEEPAKLGQR